MGSTATSQSSESVAEIFRLSLAKLGQLKLPVTPINYALIYSYFSGENFDLNNKLDGIFDEKGEWSDTEARELFDTYICRSGNEKNQVMEQELLSIVAQILGMVVDLSGRSAVSSDSLESHLSKLAVNKDAGKVLHIASDIIAETRDFVDNTRKVELSLRQSTDEIELLKGELDNARKQATIDALTGLNNRRGFDRALKSAIKSVEEDGRSFCLIMLDIDHFKNINDTHGHLVGDKVLVGIARQLTRQMRGNDYLSRYGGEEFAILLLDTPITGAFTVAENLRKSIEILRLKHTKTGQQIGKVTISLGVACYSQNETAEGLIQRCDKALYRAKSLDRNRTVLAD